VIRRLLLANHARWPAWQKFGLLLPVLYGLQLMLAQPSQNCPSPLALQEEVAAHPSAAAYDQLGAYFGQRDNFSCAISAFQSSLKLEPRSAETHYYLALALLANNDAQHASEELRLALKLNPDFPQGHMNLGAALNRLNQMDAAIDEFYTALQQDSKSAITLDWLTKSLISEKRFPEAIALLKNEPRTEVLQMNLVSAYSKSGNDDEALRILLGMVKEWPSSSTVHSGLATIYIQQRRYREAATELQEALQLNPADSLVRTSYVRALIRLGDFKTAREILQEYLPQHRNEFEPVFLMGMVDRLAGNYLEAKDLFLKALSMKPDDYDTRYNLGIVFVKSGQPVQAREQLEKALQLHPSSLEVRFQLAGVLRSLGLQDDSQRQLDLYQHGLAEQEAKDVAAAKSQQAVQYLKAGEIQKAVDSYKEAAEEDPQNSKVLYQLAMALDRKRDYEGEQSVLEKTIALDPGFASAHNQIGYLILQAGQSAEAEKEFKIALSLDPHYAEAQNNLGTLYGQQGNDAAAEQLFRQAVRNDPGYAQAFVNLGVTLASESRFAEADSALQYALRIEPNNKEAKDACAMVEAQMKK
jgi:tetratricopeptide (TPR) repeat protein